MKLPKPTEERTINVLLELQTAMPLAKLTRTSYWQDVIANLQTFVGVVRQASATVAQPAASSQPINPKKAPAEKARKPATKARRKS